MNKTFLAFATLFTFFSAAESYAGTCENFAKYGAIRAYKAEVGTVQGSDGIQYAAELVGHHNDIYQYLVSISDNNEDGEVWQVDYAVELQALSNSCKILNVAKITTGE